MSTKETEYVQVKEFIQDGVEIVGKLRFKEVEHKNVREFILKLAIVRGVIKLINELIEIIKDVF